MMSDGKNGPWIKGWADNEIEMAEDMGQDVDDFIKSDPLISKLFRLNVAEISVLEDMVAIHL